MPFIKGPELCKASDDRCPSDRRLSSDPIPRQPGCLDCGICEFGEYHDKCNLSSSSYPELKSKEKSKEKEKDALRT